MKSNERTAKYFDCRVEAFSTRRGGGPQPLPPRPLIEVLDLLSARLRVAPHHRSNRARTETWNIADIQFNAARSKVVLLVNRSDRLGADQAISDPIAGEFLVAEKERN